MTQKWLICLTVFLFATCQTKPEQDKMAEIPIKKTDTGSTGSGITKDFFGLTANGDTVDIYTLKNQQIAVKIMNYGATVTSIMTPDKQGVLADVVLGFDQLAPYLQEHPYFGSTIGRYGNRIAAGKFVLDGQTYQLATNNGNNHLHGGLKGFDKVIWQGEVVMEAGVEKLQMEYMSPDGEEAYPGNLSVRVQFYLTAEGGLSIDYFATTDKATPINLTNHSYFNLTAGANDILDHQVHIKAAQYVPVNQELIPTGELQAVTNTAFDFTNQQMSIGARIDEVPGGYDHNYVLDNWNGELNLVASVSEPSTGRRLEVLTTEPGVQFYSGNFLNGIKGKNGIAYNKHHGFCLETQHFPDSPNQPDFPECWLQPGREYRHTTVYRFGVDL